MLLLAGALVVGRARPPGPTVPTVPTGGATGPATSTAEADGDVPGRCGRERWLVKTGVDAQASGVDTATVIDTTIAALRALPAPSEQALRDHSLTRIAPVETSVYRLRGTLTSYSREADSDYHLVLADGQGLTLIVEVPAPSCVDRLSPFRDAIVSARRAVDAQYPDAERAPRATTTSRAVTVTGVGFFDFPHGQRGVAPNAIELHPVLAVEFG